MTPSTTFVAATYNRPEPLQLALRSVLAQDRPDWRVLVVGDACGPDTAAAVAAFEEPRFRYVNLPERVGDQSGPNSVGMALAETPYVALLNHDDVLLPDHLGLALGTLQRERAELFIGASAEAWATRPHPTYGDEPVFASHSPPGRRAADVFTQRYGFIEPASGWVFTRSASDRVGPWRAPRDARRGLPIQDWAMRAWREGTRFAFGDTVTVLKMSMHWAKPGMSPEHYETAQVPVDWFLSVLGQAPPDARRGALAEATSVGFRERTQLIHAPRRPRSIPAPVYRWGVERPVHALAAGAAQLYRATGFDAVDFGLHVRSRLTGQTLRSRGIDARTGRSRADAPDIGQLIARMVREHGGKLWPNP